MPALRHTPPGADPSAVRRPDPRRSSDSRAGDGEPPVPGPGGLTGDVLVPRAARDSRPALVLLGAVLVVAGLGTLLLNPDGIVVSSDPGAQSAPVALLLVPNALAIAVALLLPRGRGERAVLVRRPRSAWRETAMLLALAVGFPLLVPLLPLPEDYVLLKAAMFMVVPAVLLGVLAGRRGSSVVIQRPLVAAWVVTLPALVVGVLPSVGPFAAPSHLDRFPLGMLILAALATAITAGVGEELFYRRFLQTRLEGLIGPWTGLLVTSLLFGLMHLASHGDGPLLGAALGVIAIQGTMGLACGLIWMRWRRLWACILAHLLANGFGVVLHLLTVLG